VNSAATTTLNPGRYCGGIVVANANTGDQVFNSGLYILDAPGLQVPAGNPTNLKGNGVTFYITGSGSVQLNGTGNVTLTAPTASPSPGIPAGVLFYQDRGNPAAASINGNINFTGALYFLGATLTQGGAFNSGYAVLVADVINFSGNVGIDSDFSSLPAGSPVKTVVLVQ
jgi:hypothetical protein